MPPLPLRLHPVALEPGNPGLLLKVLNPGRHDVAGDLEMAGGWDVMGTVLTTSFSTRGAGGAPPGSVLVIVEGIIKSF